MTSANGRLVTLAALALAACGGSDDPAGNGGAGGSGGSPSGGTGGGGGSSASCEVTADESAPADVSGQWAMLDVAARLAQAPTFPEPIPNRAVTLSLLEQTQDGQALTVAGEVCDHWVNDPDDALVRTLIPDGYLTALPPFTLTGTYTVADDGTGSYRLDEYVQLIGMELDDPKGDPLPTEASDPAVFDEDEDGNPGVTVFLNGVVQGDIYVVSRRISEVEAWVTAEGRIDGQLLFDAEERVVASEPGSIKELGTVVSPDPDECKSTVTLVKLDADADCASVSERYEELFPEGVTRPAR
jgi:hypothetical protein